MSQQQAVVLDFEEPFVLGQARTVAGWCLQVGSRQFFLGVGKNFLQMRHDCFGSPPRRFAACSVPRLSRRSDPDAVPFHLVVKRGPMDAEHLGGFEFVAMGLRQRLHDGPPLAVIQVEAVAIVFR